MEIILILLHILFLISIVSLIIFILIFKYTKKFRINFIAAGVFWSSLIVFICGILLLFVYW